jgi:hypothetical protein
VIRTGRIPITLNRRSRSRSDSKVGVAAGLGLGERPFQAVGAADAGKVEERVGDRGRRDAVAGRPLIGRRAGGMMGDSPRRRTLTGAVTEGSTGYRFRSCQFIAADSWLKTAPSPPARTAAAQRPSGVSSRCPTA